MTTNDMDVAERLTRRRARTAVVFAILLLAVQPGPGGDHPVRLVDKISLGAWVLCLAVLLSFFATGGALLRGARIRALMNDESTLEHRRRGMMSGFWAAALIAAAIYGGSFIQPIGGAAAARTILTLSIAVALLRFGMLEQRSLRNG